MLNPTATEAVYSATYVDNFIDSVENVPDDLQKQITRIREIDARYSDLLRDVDHYYDLCQAAISSSVTNVRYKRAIQRMHTCLVHAQELGDEKMQLVNQIQELLDHKARQLDTVKENLDIREDMQHIQIKRMQQSNEVSTQPKQLRAQSPTRSDLAPSTSSSVSGIIGLDRNMGGKDANGSVYNNYGVQTNSTGGALTKNIDSNPHLNTMGIMGIDGRGNKRSRRRNDTISNIDFGSESNSAIEGINNTGSTFLNDRASSSRAINISGQKKITNQQTITGSNNGGSNNTGNLSLVSGVVAGTGTGNNAGKKKKRKARGGGQSSSHAHNNTRESTPPMEAIDPDEPTYCVCNQISYGEMILCDNDLCPIEWFHFSCVSLAAKPKGKWYCPNCRGDRPNTMKPKALFLKELERYNKEKEEKT